MCLGCDGRAEGSALKTGPRSANRTSVPRGDAVSPPSVSVVTVIPTWNRRHDTLACLASLARLVTPGLTHRVVLVDNASTDGTVAAVRAAWPRLELVELVRNLGFAAAVNRGVDWALAADADWVLVLNKTRGRRNDAVPVCLRLRELAGLTLADSDTTDCRLFENTGTELVASALRRFVRTCLLGHAMGRPRTDLGRLNVPPFRWRPTAATCPGADGRCQRPTRPRRTDRRSRRRSARRNRAASARSTSARNSSITCF